MIPQFLPLVISILLLARARMARGLVWREPEPTPSDLAQEKAHLGFTPRPTNAPSPFDDARGDLKLMKRSIGENLCGYESGIQSYALTCSVGRTCYFFTVANVGGMAGCCSGSNYRNCGWALDCVDSRDYSTSCRSSCRYDTFTRKCTNAAAPYCQTFTYPELGVLDYDCGTERASTYRTMRTSYSGQDDTFTVGLVTIDPSQLPSPTGESSASTLGLGSSTRTPVPVKRKSAPIGAIVGGVVGGLLFLSVVIGGILFFFCTRRRRNQTASGAQGIPQGVPQGNAPQGSAPHHPFPTASHEPFQQQHPPPMTQSPPPQYYAPVPEKPNPSQQVQEVNTQSWYGGHPVPHHEQQQQQQQHQQHQQHSEGITSPPASETVSPEGTVSGFHRPSYISVPSVESPELHGQSSSQASPPLTNHNSGPIYEVPGSQAR